MRWRRNKKSEISKSITAGATSSLINSGKRVLVPEGNRLNLKVLDKEDYSKYMQELTTAATAGKESATHIKMIHKETFTTTQDWIKTLPDGKIAPIMERVRSYRKAEYVSKKNIYLLSMNVLGLIHSFGVYFCNKAISPFYLFCNVLAIYTGSVSSGKYEKLRTHFQFVVHSYRAIPLKPVIGGDLHPIFLIGGSGGIKITWMG